MRVHLTYCGWTLESDDTGWHVHRNGEDAEFATLGDALWWLRDWVLRESGATSFNDLKAAYTEFRAVIGDLAELMEGA